MNANPYIKAFVDAEEQQRAARATYLKNVVDQGLPLFTDNCRTWLGSMWDECQVGVALGEVDDRYGVEFSLPFTWEGMNGQIVSAWWGKEQAFVRTSPKAPSVSIQLQYGTRGDYGYVFEALPLPVNNAETIAGTTYNEIACPVEPIRFGEMLLRTVARKQEADRKLREVEENRRYGQCESLQRGIQFGDEETVDRCLGTLLETFSERADEWQQLAHSRKETLAAQAAEKQRSDDLRAAWTAERDRLAEETSKIQPFTIYKVRYGARLDEDIQEHYTDEDYSLAAEAQGDGWWNLLRYGTTVRAKLFNLISVEELHINTAEEIPNGVFITRSVPSPLVETVAVVAWDLSPVGQ